jgi:hypothetical protein
VVQTPVPFANAVVQSTTPGPQAVFESASHRRPFWWKPGWHWIPHPPPTHSAEPFAGTAQGVHEVPQLCGLESDAQVPLHRCAPGSHEVSTQVPDAALHAPWPPANAVVQSIAFGPQEASVSFAHAVPLKCCPAGQAQWPLMQMVVAQSPPRLQRKVGPQGAQLPPQSTSLSVPFLTWSSQAAAAAGWQTPSSQVNPVLHGLLALSQMPSG